MGDVWAVLFMIGLLTLPLLLLGSVAYVIATAARIAALTGKRGTVWKMTLLHVALVAGLGIGLELVAERASSRTLAASLAVVLRAGSMLAVPLALRHRLAQLRSAPRDQSAPAANAGGARLDAIGDVTSHTSDEPSDVTRGRRTTASRIAWFIAVTGTLTPWLVGLGVKAYLQSVGQPTLPVAQFLDPTTLPVLVVMTLTMWSFPFLLLALVARYRILVRDHPARSFRQRLWLVWLTYAGGMIGAVLLFIGVFWQFDMIYLIVPVGLYDIPFMCLGYGAGVLALRRGWIRA